MPAFVSPLKNLFSLFSFFLFFLILWSFFWERKCVWQILRMTLRREKRTEKKITSSSIPIPPSLLPVWVWLGPLVPSYNSQLFHTKVRQKKKKRKKRKGDRCKCIASLPISEVACSHRRLLCLFEVALGGLGRRKNKVSPIVISVKM